MADARGDFLPVPGAVFSVNGIGDYLVVELGLAEDVQAWVVDPTGNFGGVMIGGEDSPQTVRRFGGSGVDSIQTPPFARN